MPFSGLLAVQSFSRDVQVHSGEPNETSPPPTPSEGPLRVFVVAGEPSGEAIAAGIMKDLRNSSGGPILFSGVGGYALHGPWVDLVPWEKFLIWPACLMLLPWVRFSKL